MVPASAGDQTLSAFTIDGNNKRVKAGIWVVNRNGVTVRDVEFKSLATRGAVFTRGFVPWYVPFPDGMWMRNGEISTVINRLLHSNFQQRAENPCIGRERADLVLAGCAILEAIRRAFPSDRLRIADRGLREGILMNMMREDSVWREGSQR